MHRLAEVRQADSEVTGQGDVRGAPATDRSEGITGWVLDLLTLEAFEKTSKQVHQAGVWEWESGIQEGGPGREMNSRTLGTEMVLKAMEQNEISQGERGSRTGPAESQGAPAGTCQAEEGGQQVQPVR